MVSPKDMERFHLGVPGLGASQAHLPQAMVDERLRGRHTRDVGDDMPHTPDWRWPGNGDSGHSAERGAPA